MTAAAVENARLHEESARLLEEVQQLHRTRERFFAMVNHELRNALAAVFGWAEMLVRKKDPATVPRAAFEVLDSAEQAIGLINDLLDLSRLDEDRLKPVYPGRRAGARWRSGRWAGSRPPPTGKRRHAGSPARAETCRPATPTPAGWSRSCVNLLSNAIRHSPAGSEVSSAVDRDGGNARVHGARTKGPGVPEDEVERIFDIYVTKAGEERAGHRARASRSPAGWRGCWAASSGPSAAARRAGASSSSICRSRRRVVKFLHESVERDFSRRIPRFRPMKILVVEDDRKVAGFIEQGLKEEGYVVDVAPDGDEATMLAHVYDYDVILLDVVLPKKNGFQVATELRREGRNTPILMLTSRDAVEDVVRGLDAGADDYLAKPFRFDELLARIRALHRRGGAERLDVLRYGPLTLDRLRHTATINERARSTSPPRNSSCWSTSCSTRKRWSAAPRCSRRSGTCTSTPRATWWMCTSATCGGSSPGPRGAA